MYEKEEREQREEKQVKNRTVLRYHKSHQVPQQQK